VASPFQETFFAWRFGEDADKVSVLLHLGEPIAVAIVLLQLKERFGIS